VAAQQVAVAVEVYRTREGSEARGYKADTASNFGPWGQKAILDVPFSVNVISSGFIQDRMAFTPDDVFKVSPVTQATVPMNRSFQSFVNLRGFENSAQAIDGMRTGTFNSTFLTLEDKERVEIYTGVIGFLYGGTDVGGMVNYVYKRPTPVPYASVTLGNLGNTSGIAHLDLGGPIDKEGKFGYRLNIVGQDGALPFPAQNETCYGITGAFDWNLTPDTKIGLLGSHQYGSTNRQGAQWAPGGGFDYNFVPNPHKKQRVCKSTSF
jgi:iron complex outermembrane receptor protein